MKIEKVCRGSFTHGRKCVFDRWNACNVNFNNGNVNNNNMNNTNNVLALSEFQSTRPAKFDFFFDMLTQAVRDCMKHKKTSYSAVLYRINEEFETRRLYNDLREGTYTLSRSIAFLTEGREVFAAHIRDRVVHHLLANEIVPLLEAQFVPNTWNCRKGKGTLAAIQDLRRNIAEQSEGFTRDCWVLMYDLSGFFMNIDREAAAGRLCDFVAERYKEPYKPMLLYYLRKVITHAPESDCTRMGTREEWDNLPERKSLFFRHGLPIGDLLSQLDGNFELDPVDHYIAEVVPADRYVDDNALVSADKDLLKWTMPEIRRRLAETSGAVVNPKKYKFCHWSQGFRYLGVIIKGPEAYPSGKTVGKAFDLIRHANALRNKPGKAERVASRLNSYLGLLGHFDTERTRERLFARMLGWGGMISPGEGFKKAVVSQACRRRCRLRADIRKQSRQFNEFRRRILCRI